MNFNIAQWHISVQRRTRVQWAPFGRSEVERKVGRTRQIEQVEQQRERVQTWFALHGGH